MSYTAKGDRVFDGAGEVAAECVGPCAEAMAEAIAGALNRPPVTYRAVVEWASYDCGGADILDFDAASVEEAAAKAIATMSDEATAITVFAVVGQTVADVDGERERRREAERIALEARDREDQRKEYERLRAIFDPTP